MMNSPSFDTLLLFVFFIYGLTFFTMGIALAFEGGRFPALAAAKVLRPLAIFGLIHGTHEWVDAYLLQSDSLQVTLPVWVSWFRLALLISSFIFLIIFDIQAFRLFPHSSHTLDRILFSLLGIYLLVITISAGSALLTKQVRFDQLFSVLARYILAVPGAIAAAFSLRAQALNSSGEERKHLVTHLTVAAVGFGIYGLAQLFVADTNMFPARYINAEAFRTWSGFPVQVVRMAAAILITLGLVRATQLAERERQRQLQAVQKMHLDAIEERDRYRHELLLHTVKAQEEERSRVARELHDETSQILAAFSLALATLRKRASRSKDALPLVDQLQLLSKQMSQSLYRLVHDLRPAELDDLGLVPAIHYLQENNAQKGLNVSIDVSGHYRRLDPIVETVLFRVAQEALNNVVRHAQVAEAHIQVDFLPQKIILRISDAGIGFDPEKPLTPPHGWGLAGMMERVSLVGGQLLIESASGKGTKIVVIVPMDDVIKNEEGIHE